MDETVSVPYRGMGSFLFGTVPNDAPMLDKFPAPIEGWVGSYEMTAKGSLIGIEGFPSPLEV